MRCLKKTRVKLFRLSSSTGSPNRKTHSKNVQSKKPFFDCIRNPDLGPSRKGPFSTDKSDCVRNGLTRKKENMNEILRQRSKENIARVTNYSDLPAAGA